MYALYLGYLLNESLMQELCRTKLKNGNFASAKALEFDIQPSRELNAPQRVFFIDQNLQLEKVEFQGKFYLAKSCGHSTSPEQLSLLVSHLLSVMQKIFPDHAFNSDLFLLFPVLC